MQARSLLLGAVVLIGCAAVRAADVGSRYAGVPEYAFVRVEAAQLRAARRTGRITVPLPGGQFAQFVVLREQRQAGVVIFRGARGNDRLLLTTDGISAYGRASVDGKSYVIDTDFGSIVVADESRLPDDVAFGGANDVLIDDEMVSRLLAQSAENRSRASDGLPDALQDAPTVVDIAVFYDSAIETAEGRQVPHTWAQAAVAFTNDAIAAHGVPLELRLVYVGQYPGTVPFNPFNTFVGNSSAYATAEHFGADLLHLVFVYRGESYCGRAHLVGRYGVTAKSCGFDTFAHEVGHNFGAHHDRANASGNVSLPINQYNYGYVCGGSGTLMAYYSPSVPHFSDPDLFNNGAACGVPAGQPGAAENGLVLDVMRAQIANFRTTLPVYGTVRIADSSDLQVNEEDTGTITVRLVRDGDLSPVASVEVATIDETATLGADYELPAGRVVFEAGEAERSVSIQIIDDDIYEPVPERFQVVLRYPRNLQVLPDTRAITISSTDPDRGSAEFVSSTVSLNEAAGTALLGIRRIGPASLPLTVKVSTVDGTARSGADFDLLQSSVTFGAGETDKQVAVSIIDNTTKQGCNERTFTVQLSGAVTSQSKLTAYLTDDDMTLGQAQLGATHYVVRESDGAATVRVERTGGTECSITGWVSFEGGGTAVGGRDYDGGISYGFTLSNGQSFVERSTAIYDNSTVDGERWFVTELLMQDPQQLAAPAEARVTIVDDEQPAPAGGSLEVLAGGIAIDESAGIAFVPVKRVGGRAGAALVDYQTVAGSATAKSDYVSSFGTLRWLDGDASDRVVAIAILDDKVEEPTESFQLVLSRPAGAALGNAITTIDIVNDEHAPVSPAAIASQTATEGVSLGFTVPQFTDKDGDVLTYEFTGLPNWLQVRYPAQNPRYLSGRPPFTESTPDNDKVYTITVKATDPWGLSASQSFTLTVQNVNRAPVASTVSNRIAFEAKSFGYSVPAFTDPDGESLTYAFSGLPAWLKVTTPDVNPRYMSGTPPLTESSPDGNASYSITITATDPNGASTARTFKVVVADNRYPVPGALVNQVATENVAFAYNMPAFTDPDGDAITYTFFGLPSWLKVTNPAANPRYLSGKPPYTESTRSSEKVYNITVNARDAVGQTTQRTFTLVVKHVNRPPVPPTIADQVAYEGSTFSFNAPRFSDPDGDALTYSFSGLPVWLKVTDPAVNDRYLSGRPPYTEASPGNPAVYPITVTATDQDGLQASRTFNLTVQDVPN